MSLVATIVKSIQGKAEVQSEQGVGTCVTVTVPLQRPLDEDTTHGANEAVTKPGSLDGLTIAFLDQPETEDDGHALLTESLTKTSQMLGLKLQPRTQDFDDADVRLMMDHTFRNARPETLDTIEGSRNDAVGHGFALVGNKPMIVLCNTLAARSLRSSYNESRSTRNVQVIAQPVGPVRLASAIRSCIAAGKPHALSENDASQPRSPVDATSASHVKLPVRPSAAIGLRAESWPITKSDGTGHVATASTDAWGPDTDANDSDVKSLQSKTLSIKRPSAGRATTSVELATLKKGASPNTDSTGALTLLLVDDNVGDYRKHLGSTY